MIGGFTDMEKNTRSCDICNGRNDTNVTELLSIRIYDFDVCGICGHEVWLFLQKIGDRYTKVVTREIKDGKL
jgi:hypothetical protein